MTCLCLTHNLFTCFLKMQKLLFLVHLVAIIDQGIFYQFFFTWRNVQQILKFPQKCKIRLISIVTQLVNVVVIVDVVVDVDVMLCYVRLNLS